LPSTHDRTPLAVLQPAVASSGMHWTVCMGDKRWHGCIKVHQCAVSCKHKPSFPMGDAGWTTERLSANMPHMPRALTSAEDPTHPTFCPGTCLCHELPLFSCEGGYRPHWQQCALIIKLCRDKRHWLYHTASDGCRPAAAITTSRALSTATVS